jgi:hypothetical protein
MPRLAGSSRRDTFLKPSTSGPVQFQSRSIRPDQLPAFPSPVAVSLPPWHIPTADGFDSRSRVAPPSLRVWEPELLSLRVWGAQATSPETLQGLPGAPREPKAARARSAPPWKAPQERERAVLGRRRAGAYTVYSGRIGFSICAEPSSRGFVERPNPSSRVGFGLGPRPDPRVAGLPVDTRISSGRVGFGFRFGSNRYL